MSDFSKKLHNFAKNAGWRLGKVDTTLEQDWEDDAVTQLIRLRNKIHEQDLEIMYLKAQLDENTVLRKKHPAVREAWEQYKIVLALFKKN